MLLNDLICDLSRRKLLAVESDKKIDVIDLVIRAAFYGLGFSGGDLSIRCVVAHLRDEFASLYANGTNVSRHILDGDAALIPDKLVATQFCPSSQDAITTRERVQIHRAVERNKFGLIPVAVSAQLRLVG